MRLRKKDFQYKIERILLNPIWLFFILNIVLFVLYNLDIYYFKFISIPIGNAAIIFISISLIILGMVSASLLFLSCQPIEFSKEIYYNNSNKYKMVFLFEIAGFAASFIKLIYFVKYFGFPTNLEFFGKVRISYLTGEFTYPIILDVFALLLWPVIITHFVLYKTFRNKRHGKHFILAAFLLFLNNIITAGRGIVGFLILLVLLYDLYIDNILLKKPINKQRILLLFSFLLIFMIAIGLSRTSIEGITKGIIYGLNEIALYFLGPFPATSLILDKYLDGNIQNSMGLFTFGGLLRYSLGLFVHYESPFGYVPIYSNLDYGFNSFTCIAYLIVDFGIIGLFIFLFLIGFLTSYFYYKLKYNFTILRLVVFVNLLALLLYYERDIMSKWVSWWLCFLSVPMINQNIKIQRIGNDDKQREDKNE